MKRRWVRRDEMASLALAATVNGAVQPSRRIQAPITRIAPALISRRVARDKALASVV